MSSGTERGETVRGHFFPLVFFKKPLCKPRKKEHISVCGQVSEPGSKLVPCIAQRIKHVLWFSVFFFSLSPPLVHQPYHMSPHKSPIGFSDGVFLQPV